MGDSRGGMTVPKGSEENLVFGFNDLDFSDRILRLEITPDFDNDEDSTASSKKLKAEKYNDWFSCIQNTEDSKSFDAAKVTTLHICSLLLVGKSRFFYKLFKNGMRESQQKTEFCLKINASAKKHVLNRYKDFTKSQDEAMQLPLSALEVVLGSKGLEVESEDVTFDFVLKWARASYPNLEERREILTKRLAPLICFSDMSVPKLKEVLACIDYDYEHVSKLVHEALFSKVERSCGQLIRETNVLSTTEYPSAGRVYYPHCVVFFDLTKQECVNLFQKGIETPQFRLGGKMISLLACYVAEKFGLFVTALETCRADFEIAVMRKSSRQFESKLKVNNHNLDVCGYRGKPNLLNITCTELASGRL